MRRARSAGAKRSVRTTGSRRSRWTSLARAIQILAAWFGAAWLALPFPAGAQALRSYAIVGDAIPERLTNTPGDAARGRALVVERSSTCILCHSGLFPELRFQ